MTTASKPTITIETTTNVWDIFDIVQPLAGHAVVAHAGGVRLTACVSGYHSGR
jgi:hypothetical protein